jgi:hypothetical protein
VSDRYDETRTRPADMDNPCEDCGYSGIGGCEDDPVMLCKGWKPENLPDHAPAEQEEGLAERAAILTAYWRGVADCCLGEHSDENAVEAVKDILPPLLASRPRPEQGEDIIHTIIEEQIRINNIGAESQTWLEAILTRAIASRPQPEAAKDARELADDLREIMEYYGADPERVQPAWEARIEQSFQARLASAREQGGMTCPSCGCVVDKAGRGHHSAADCVFLKSAEAAEREGAEVRADARRQISEARVEGEEMREEIEVLREYGNKDCTWMADDELKRRRAAIATPAEGRKMDGLNCHHGRGVCHGVRACVGAFGDCKSPTEGTTQEGDNS